MPLKSQVRAYLSRRLGVPEIPFSLQRLSQIGFYPNHIFDVGAYQGDFALTCLQIWPQVNVSCFEALHHRVTQLNQLAETHQTLQVFPGLLGAKSQENVPLYEAETASSVLTEHIPQNFPVTFHPMWTIDQIVQEHFKDSPPDFLKLDVQGYELEVLKGAEQSLSKMQVILAEINLLDIHENVPLLAEVIAWLNERGWVAYDICGLTRRPLDHALWQADFMFVPQKSFLRSDKRWQSVSG